MKNRTTAFSILRLLIIISVFIALIYSAAVRKTSYTSVNEYATSEIEYTDGSTAAVSNTEFGIINSGDRITVHLQLPDEAITVHPVLAFRIYHSITRIYCDGVLVDSFGQEIADTGNMVGGHEFLTSLPDDCWGKEITIELEATENHAFSQVKNLYIYPAASAWEYYLDIDSIGIWICVPMLFAAVLALLFQIMSLDYSSNGRKGLCIALSSLLISLWVVLSSGVQNLFGWTGYVWTQLEYIAVFCMVLPILFYVYESETGVHSKQMLRQLITVNALFVFICTVLNFANIAHYCSTLLASHILSFVSGIILLCYAFQHRASGSFSNRLFFDGILILFITGIFDLVRFNIFKYLPSLHHYEIPSTLPIGALFFVIFLIQAYYNDMTVRQRRLITSEVKADTLQNIISSTPAGIAVFKYSAVTGRVSVMDANERFYQIFGEGEANPDIRQLVKALQASELQKLIADNEDRLKSGVEYSDETELHVNTGTDHARTVLCQYHFEGCRTSQFNINVVDITERKAMEDEIRISQERYKLALNQSGKIFFFFDIPSRTMHLSSEIAQSFRLPEIVRNMPDNEQVLSMVEPESMDTFRAFYQRIIAGKPSGNSMISCHVKDQPDQMRWYKLSFNSIFNEQKEPSSAVITFEDMTHLHESELENRWKQNNLLTLPESSYEIAEYDFTKDVLLKQTGGLFEPIASVVNSYEAINEMVLNNFIYSEDVEKYRAFLDKERLIAQYRSGTAEDSIEYRSVQHGTEYRWTKTAVQLIEDPFSSHIMAQFLFTDIHEERDSQIAMKADMEALQKELDNSRIKIMINQMQPHFLYNSLSAIQAIVKTDPDYAYQLLFDFTVHLRSSIKALSSDEPIPFNDELKNIKAYLNIERMRFGDRLNVKYEIDCEDFLIIPLSIQPLAENAAIHGILPKQEQGGTVTIRTYETFKSYIVEVEDDGVGFDAGKVMSEQGDSVGLKNTIFRLKSLMNATVDIDSQIGTGTKVTVSIPKERRSLQ